MIRKQGTERIISQSVKAIENLRKLAAKVTVPKYIADAITPIADTLESNLETLNGVLHGPQTTFYNSPQEHAERLEREAQNERQRKQAAK